MEKYSTKLHRFYEKMKAFKIPARITFMIMGVAATIWFIFRVLPKPQRAAYPCMRVAAPVMSSFVIYLLSLSGIVLAFRQSKKKLFQARYLAATGFLFISIISTVVYFIATGEKAFSKNPPNAPTSDGANAPMGVSVGIKPGRVAWAWSPEATNEACTNKGPTNTICSGTDSTLMWPSETNSDYYFLKKNNNQKVIDSMVYDAILSVADTNIIVEAWAKIFKNFNIRKGKGNVGYKATEKIFIKVNLGGMWVGATKLPHLNPNPVGYSGCYGAVDGNLRRLFQDQGVYNSPPFAVLSVVKSLVDAGVSQNMIYIGDPIKNVYQDMYDYWKSLFPNINVIGNNINFNSSIFDVTTLGRVEVKNTSTDKIFYSDKGTALTVTSDKLYDIHEQAEYLINMAVLKAHACAGITLCAKNHFGSQGRNGASHLHKGLLSSSNDAGDRLGYGKYRVQVDLMGHKLLGENTLLFIVDGTWAHEEGYDAKPMKKWRMAPFNNDYPNSIFMSQDGVAIESVCLDFLRSEYDSTMGRTNRPNYYGVDDYLHQAADPSKWAAGITYDPENDGTPMGSMGIHEHWNNKTLKQYSRNLNSATGKGIELVYLKVILQDSVMVNQLKVTHNNKTTLSSIYPNPVTDVLQIQYILEVKSNVTIEIINIKGELVNSIVTKSLLAGQYDAQWQVQGIPAGIYFCRMISNNEYGVVKQTKQFQVIK